MHRNSKTQTIIGELCHKLQCSELAEDLERLNHAREMLAKLQQMEIFRTLNENTEKSKPKTHFNNSQKLSNILLKTKQRLEAAKASSSSISGVSGDKSVHSIDEYEQLEEEYEIENSRECEEFSKDAWLGFFPGYEILDENQECILNENKQCIELSLSDGSSSLENYLRGGIRCFMIDLFVGTALENQKLIFKLRESELKISREYGFPITTTLFALMSPRLQYTGLMNVRTPTVEMEKEDELILTTKRKYSSIGNFFKIYVNARFLIEECKEGDFILVGPSIQLMVTEVLEEELRCIVMEPGTLSTRLPVRFPASCSRSQISLEELEDITFAREVGINVLVSYNPGTQQYLTDFYNALRLLKSDNLRIFTRLVLSKYKEDEEITDLEWIADRYDGFLVELSDQQTHNCCEREQDQSNKKPNILKLSTQSVNFMTAIYKMKKPIILNAFQIAERQLCVQPHNIPHIFSYPDKFIFSSANYHRAFYFYQLQNAFTEHTPLIDLSLKPFCDTSELGDDTLAQACVAASFESQAKAIVVCSSWSDMSLKLSHFRPKAPIIHVSDTKSLGEYISLYHHIIFMHFRTLGHYIYSKYVTNAFIFCIIFLKARNILHNGENILLVYGSKMSTNLCDTYLVYKFNEKHFSTNLEEILFV